MIAVILAGGEGKRLYPLSTKEKPKQFLKLSGTQYSLFQETIKRAIELNVSKIIIATNIIYKNLVTEQLADLDYKDYELLLETEKLNTFIPIFVALKHIQIKYGSTEHVIIFPSDHFFGNFGYFTNKLNKYITKKQDDNLILFGTTVSELSSNYGYIIEEDKNRFAFVEKPSLEKLENIRKTSLNIYVNSGIFLVHKKIANRIIQDFDKNIDIEIIKIDNKCSLLKNKKVNVTYRYSFDIMVVEKLNQLSLIDITKSLWMDLGNKDSLQIYKENYC